MLYRRNKFMNINNEKINKKNSSSQSGFTLTELLVAMGIIFFLATITLTNYNKFGRTIDLENTAYEVALAVREAQIFGINRLSDSVTGSGAVDLDTDVSAEDPIPYGVYFDISPNPIPGTGQKGFINFVDVVDSNPITQERLFNPSALPAGNCLVNNSTECLSTAAFTGRTYIHSMCSGDSAAVCDPVETLHITFKRPDPDAEIKVNSSDTDSYARITLGSLSDDALFKSIAIGVAGQITIE